MEYLISVFWISIELLSLFLLCSAFLPMKRSRKQTALLYAYAVLVILLINNFPAPILKEFPFARRVLLLCVVMLLSALCFRWNWYGHLLLASLFQLLLAAMDTVITFGASWAFGLSMSELVWKKWLYVMVVTVDKCLLLLGSYLVWHWQTKKALQPRLRGSSLRFAVFPLASILMLFTTFESYKTQEDLSAGTVVFSLVLVVANAAVLMIMHNMERNARTDQEIALLHQSMALQRENIRSLEESYRAQRSASHEYGHQLQTIRDLLQQHDFKAAEEYVTHLQKTQSDRIFAVNTRHPVIDVILNEKYRMARERDIDVHFQVNDLSSLSVPTDALVVLLSNLLDNAIEACEKMPDKRRIECSLLLEDGLYGAVRNTSLPVVIREDRIATTKTPAREHGFGLSAVRRILDELKGEYAMEYQEGYFTFAFEIPIPDENPVL